MVLVKVQWHYIWVCQRVLIHFKLTFYVKIARNGNLKSAARVISSQPFQILHFENLITLAAFTFSVFIYLPGSKSEALQLGVQLNFLIFYQDLTLEYGDFFFILVVGGRGWMVDVVPLFGSSNLLILIWYILQMYMYIFSYSHNFRQNSCGFNFVIKLEKFSTIFKITLLR